MILKELNSAALALAASAGWAAAEVPQVVTDIAPVHSLAAMVMGDLGAPDLVLPPGASPHGYAMRPSAARALQEADLVFWVGEALTPWLARPLTTLPDHGQTVELMELPGVTHLAFRQGAELEVHHLPGQEEDHDHEEGHDHEDGHDHDDGHDEDHAEHDDPGVEPGHEGHVHEGLDPHGWLDPENARVWLTGMAEALAAADPENAATYRANAEAARADLAAQSARIAEELAAAAPIRFLVYHDAYQYFENRFDLTSAGAVTDSDATAPSAARVAALRDKVSAAGVDCLFTEPQFGAGLAGSVFEESDGKLVEIDPLGSALSAGPDLYPALLEGMAQSFLTCKG